MINLTWAQIRDPEFNPILDRILNSKMPFPSARKVLAIMKDVRSEQEASDQLWAKLCSDYMEPVPDQPQYMRVREGVNAVEAQTRIQEFLSTPVEINRPRITNDELQTFDITPVQLLKLEGLIEATE